MVYFQKPRFTPFVYQNVKTEDFKAYLKTTVVRKIGAIIVD